MWVRIMVLFTLVLFSGYSLARDNTPECYSFFYKSEQQSAGDLQEIAKNCPVEELADLYRNRAAHIELLSEQSSIRATEFQPRTDYDRDLEEYRIYIALMETFAIHFEGSLADLINGLNIGYEDAMELAKLKLQGFNKRAEWLEWYRALQKN